MARNPDPVTAAHQAAALLAATQVASVVMDCESGAIRLGLAAGLARALDGTLLRLDELAAGPLADSVRAFTFPPHSTLHHGALHHGALHHGALHHGALHHGALHHGALHHGEVA